MSIINEAAGHCSKCGKENHLKIYRSINTAENPELKKAVMNGSLFLWTCSACGQLNLARYETLYHDPDGKLMIWLLPDGDLPETQMHSITLHAKAIGNYTLRRVDDMGSLMEKVLIAEAGLDDRVIEMCKYVTKLELTSGNSQKAAAITAAGFHFYRIEDNDGQKTIVLTFPDSETGNMASVRIGYNVYQDCAGILERNPVKTDEGFIRIDQEWILSLMK